MEQLDTILQKLGAAQLWQKLLGLVVAVALLVGGYYFFFLDDILTQRAQMLQDQEKLNKEKAEYETRKKEYLAYKQEVANLEEEQKDMLRLLPKNDDIEQFVEAMNQQIELAGLTKAQLIRSPRVGRELYYRLPVKMTVFGSYHQVMKFFKSMGEVPRIVNIEELSLAPITDAKAPPDTLKAEFVAVAFQYREPRLQTKPTTPAAPAGGLKPAATAGKEGEK